MWKTLRRPSSLSWNALPSILSLAFCDLVCSGSMDDVNENPSMYMPVLTRRLYSHSVISWTSAARCAV